MRLARTPASRTTRSPASTSEPPNTVEDWTIRLAPEPELASASARTEATTGTALSLIWENFLVRLPIILFFTSLTALSLISQSVEARRSRMESEVLGEKDGVAVEYAEVG